MIDIQSDKKKLEQILNKLNSDNAILYDQKEGDYLPKNYTVNCFFRIKDLEPVHNLIERLKLIDEQQFFYNKEQLHITLLGQIDIKCDKDQLINTVQNFLDNNNIKFKLFGVGSSLKVASVTAYPVDFEMDKFRSEIRGLGGGTAYDPPYEELGWINIMRYLKKPTVKLLNAFKSETDTDFGLVSPESILLLENSSRLLIGAREVHRFSLKRD